MKLMNEGVNPYDPNPILNPDEDMSSVNFAVCPWNIFPSCPLPYKYDSCA